LPNKLSTKINPTHTDLIQISTHIQSITWGPDTESTSPGKGLVLFFFLAV